MATEQEDIDSFLQDETFYGDIEDIEVDYSIGDEEEEAAAAAAPVEAPVKAAEKIKPIPVEKQSSPPRKRPAPPLPQTRQPQR